MGCPMSSTHQYPFAKCGSCGWLHIAMPAAVAQKAVADFNAARERGGWPDRPAVYDRYLRCRHCGASTHQFLPALESDARHGITLQGCVVERADFGVTVEIVSYDKLAAPNPTAPTR